jgi:phospholipid/cholesterol/gamma-HCH transport system substrate-binding protein
MPRTRSVTWSELKLGVIGVTTLALVATTIVAIGVQGGFAWQRYPLKTRFSDAMGLKPGAVVRLNGKDVGTVTDVEFVGAEVEVVFEVRDEVRSLLTTESSATIGSLSLLGEPSVDLRAATSGRVLNDGEMVPAVDVAPGFGALSASAGESLEQIGSLLTDLRAGRGTLGQLVTDDRLYRELTSFTESAAAVTRVLREGEGTLGRLLQDPAAHEALKTSMQNLEAITARIDRGEGALGRLLNDSAVGDSIAATTANLEATTARLNRGEGTAGKLMTDSQLYDRLNGVAERAERVLTSLEAGDGTAGQLLRDRRLYENMNTAVAELRGLVEEIRKDPKKFLRVSVSIF